jgi:biopolymer transport protein ExbD
MIRFMFLILLVFTSTLIAQTVKTVTNNIKVEMLSESKNLEDGDQYIRVRLTCETPVTVNFYSLSFENTEARWTIVTAQKNSEELWLLKSSIKSNYDNVLAWTFDEETHQLQFYPPGWQIPYVLDIQLQMNLMNSEKTEKQFSDKLVVEADMETGVFSTSPTGRGNEITLR